MALIALNALQCCVLCLASHVRVDPFLDGRVDC